MRHTTPVVFLISRPSFDWSEVENYLLQVGGSDWVEKRIKAGGFNPGQTLIEIMGRLCYRSWSPGLNPNVTKIREQQSAYLQNIQRVGHGSVLEHAHYSFIFHNISRVFTHELVRHRHENISQESLRFVRLTDIPFWHPDWAKEDEELIRRNENVIGVLEEHQRWMAEHFKLDEEGVSFAEKKHKTSFMRRLALIGLSTGIGWTANIRGIRHVLTMRTEAGAEEEIRKVFGDVGHIMKEECPDLFADFEWIPDEEGPLGTWRPEYRKV